MAFAPSLLLFACRPADHRLVDLALVQRVHAHQLFGDHVVHVLHGLLHALAEVALLVAIAQLYRLVLAGGRAGGHRRAAHAPELRNTRPLRRSGCRASQGFHVPEYQ
jgi:hypothetical protein